MIKKTHQIKYLSYFNHPKPTASTPVYLLPFLFLCMFSFNPVNKKKKPFLDESKMPF